MPRKKEENRGPVYTRSPEGVAITEWRGACEILNRRLTKEESTPVCDQSVVSNLVAQGKLPVIQVIHHVRFYSVDGLESMSLEQLKEYKERPAFDDAIKDQAVEAHRKGENFADIAKRLSALAGRQVSRQQVRTWYLQSQQASKGGEAS